MDDVSQLWSWGLAIIGISGVYLTTKKLYWGFVVGITVQILWITYALVSQQYGFILSALGFAWVNALGLYRWTRTSEAKPKDLSWGQGHKARVYDLSEGGGQAKGSER